MVHCGRPLEGREKRCCRSTGVVLTGFGLALGCVGLRAQTLPDAPSAVLAARAEIAAANADNGAGAESQDAFLQSQQGQRGLQGMPSGPPTLPAPVPCIVSPPLLPGLAPRVSAAPAPPATAATPLPAQAGQPCEEDPVQLIVTSPHVPPLTSRQKGLLAFRDLTDPFNLIVILGGAGISIAANSHSAYGPGFKGWGKLSGYSFVEDAQGEFIGTYMIASLAREDPRYHRMPGAPVKRRILHALSHTFVTQHDDGSRMLNYETLLTYPISAELSNLYVPGIATDGPSTAKRIGLGLATDPAGGLIAEFLPDIAKRIHIRVLFMQQILNQVAIGSPAVMQ